VSATYRRHAPGCIAEQAWDIPEAQGHCTCSFPFPFPVCSECGNRPHQHSRLCERHPKYDPEVARKIIEKAEREMLQVESEAGL
jgi:hypothetical protein